MRDLLSSPARAVAPDTHKTSKMQLSMPSRTTAQFLVAMMRLWRDTYLAKMKRKFMQPPKQKLTDNANLSANDTLHVQQALVLVMVVMRVEWHWKYNSPSTSPPSSNFQKLPPLASWLLKIASCHDKNNEIFKNETTCKNYFLRGLLESFQSALERGHDIFFMFDFPMIEVSSKLSADP